MRIICVEDDAGLRSVMVETLHYLDPDAQIDIFSNSDDVLPALREQDMYLCLMDVRIPGAMNGFALAQYVRDLGYDGVIALMSAYPRPQGDMLRHLRCEWLSKPIDVDTLDALVQKARSTRAFR